MEMPYPLSKPPLVKHVMTPFPYTITPSHSLREAKEMMAEHEFHHLPVAEDDVLLGILSDRDVRRALDPVFALGEEEQVLVESVYRKTPYSCDLNTRLDVVLLEMAAQHYGSALVTRNEKLAGIFTSTDACKIFGEYLAQRFPLTPGDEAA